MQITKVVKNESAGDVLEHMRFDFSPGCEHQLLGLLIDALRKDNPGIDIQCLTLRLEAHGLVFVPKEPNHA